VWTFSRWSGGEKFEAPNSKQLQKIHHPDRLSEGFEFGASNFGFSWEKTTLIVRAP